MDSQHSSLQNTSPGSPSSQDQQQQQPHLHQDASGAVAAAQHPATRSSRATRSPEFEFKLKQMALELCPLVSLTTGEAHPEFPATLLQYWLLTDSQLDELAGFYHQRYPSRLTYQYPCPVEWREGLTVAEKRRKMGRFIGLRGCESPVVAKTEEQIMEEARRARLAAEEEMWRRKTGWY